MGSITLIAPLYFVLDTFATGPASMLRVCNPSLAGIESRLGVRETAKNSVPTSKPTEENRRVPRRQCSGATTALRSVLGGPGPVPSRQVAPAATTVPPTDPATVQSRSHRQSMSGTRRQNMSTMHHCRAADSAMASTTAARVIIPL